MTSSQFKARLQRAWTYGMLEAECERYAGKSLGNWLKEAYWKWAGSSSLLAEMLDVSPDTARSMLKSYGVGIRGRGGVCYTPKPAKKQLEKDYDDEGMTVRQMGRKYNVSHQTICNWLDSDEIKLRRNHRRKNALLPLLRSYLSDL